MTTLTGRAAFLPFALPTVDEEDIADVVDVLRSGWLTSGPRIQDLEREFAAQATAPAALALNSGTAAMHVALSALGVPAGSAVITTPMTFCSTAHVIEQIGCRPLFVDIEADTLNIDPDGVQRALAADGPPVGAVLPVHYGGHPCELDRIVGSARAHGVPVVEDAAHAFGAAFRGTPVGSVGTAGPDGRDDRAACFPLYATQNITSGEGEVLTGGEVLVRAARPWSLHGMTRDSWQRYGPRGSWEYEVRVPGFKYNMSDVQAALARAQLRRWRVFQDRRTAIAARYSELLATVEEVQVPSARPHVTHAWHLYPLRLHLPALRIDRAEFAEQLRGRNIGTSVHFIPLHTQPYYRDRYGFARDDFPVTAAEFDRLLSLPIYPRMTDGDVEDVVAAVRDVVTRNRRRS